jgi:hypothetical protein
MRSQWSGWSHRLWGTFRLTWRDLWHLLYFWLSRFQRSLFNRNTCGGLHGQHHGDRTGE